MAEKIFFNSLEEEIPQVADYQTTYSFNTFALLNDGTVVATGKDIGDKEKEIAVTGDLVQTTSHVYSDTFLPVTLEEFSIKKICKDCQIIKRRGRVTVVCKHPKHKQRQG